MAAIVTRAGKGSILTSSEMDANLVNLNTELADKQTRFLIGTCSTAASTVQKTVTLSAPWGPYYVVPAGSFLLVTYSVGQTASSATMSVNSGDVMPVKIQNAVASNVGHRTAAGGCLLYYYDGSAFHLVGSQQHADANSIYSGIASDPTLVVANTTCAVNRAYLANSASLLTFTLPATASITSLISIVGVAAGGWTLVPPVGVTLKMRGRACSSISGGAETSVTVRAVVTNTTWQVDGFFGNIVDDAGNTTNDTVSQADAEAGVSTAVKAWTVQRVWQAIAKATALKANTLATPRLIGNQSFDGSANISIPKFEFGVGVPDDGGGLQDAPYFQVLSSAIKLWTKGVSTWTYSGVQIAPAQTTLFDDVGDSTLPSDSETSLVALLQTTRNCLKWLVANTVQLTGDQTVAGVKTLSSRSSHAGAYTPSQTPSHSATPTFDCATSNVFEPAAMTSNVTSVTLSNAVAGQTVQIRFQQDATGGRTVALPSGAKVSGSVATGANRVSILTMTYSSRGTRWEGNWMQVPA